MGDLRKIKVKDLAVGLYVHLPGSWHTHPFLLSRFKIRSQEDIAKIANLGYTSVMYDAECSDAEAIPEPGSSAVIDPPTAEGNPEAAPLPSSSDGSRMLDQCLRTLRKGLENYKNLLGESKTILSHINAGRREGVKMAEDMTTQIAQLLSTEHDAVAVASLMPLDEETPLSLSHALNVATLSMMVGRDLGLPTDQLGQLGVGGLLHDVGEDRLPRSLILKRTPLTAAERSAFKLHPQYGEQQVAQLQALPAEVIAMIAQHHERLDGSGYPKGLKADAITPLTGVLSVVDRYEELINASKAKGMSPSEALAELYREQRIRYPSKAVVALICVATIYPPGTVVQLTDGRIGLVLAVNSQARLRPLLAVYEPRATSCTPAMIDLRHHPQLEISRILALDQVPAEIQAYLNPHRLIGYFVCRSPSSHDERSV